MAKYKCPSCGMPYDGKLCRECLYEPFMEEISHGNHTHTGEPLVVDAPVRKPIKRKDPFGCEKKTKTKRGSRRFGLAVLLLVLSMLNPMLTFLFEEISETREIVSSFAPEPEPEPIALPEDGTVLYDSGDIRIIADWRDGQDFGDGFSVVMQNDSSRNIMVSAMNIVVNDYVLEYSSLFCEATAESLGMGYFYLDETDLRNTQLTSLQDLSFSLMLCDSDSYEILTETETITLYADVPEGAARHSELGGTVLLEQDGIQIRYLGYAPDPNYPEDFRNGNLLFYLENNTDRYLQCWMPESSLNGEDVDLSLWCELPAGTRAVTSVYLYYLEESGVNSAADLENVIFRLEIDDWDDYDFSLLTEPISFGEITD